MTLMPERPRWISVGAAARDLGRSTETVRRWLREGLLRGRQLRPRGWIEVDRRSVDEVIREARMD